MGRRAASVAFAFSPGERRPRLVDVRDHRQLDAVIADVGEVRDDVVGHLLLQRHVPALDVAGRRVRRHVERDVVGQVRRIALLRGPEAAGELVAGALNHAAVGAARQRLGHRGARDDRVVGGEQAGAGQAIEVDVADAVAAADDGVLQAAARPGRSAARSCCGRARPAPGRRSTRRVAAIDGAGRRIEVREAVLGFVVRRHVLVAQAEVERSASR